MSRSWCLDISVRQWRSPSGRMGPHGHSMQQRGRRGMDVACRRQSLAQSAVGCRMRQRQAREQRAGIGCGQEAGMCQLGLEGGVVV